MKRLLLTAFVLGACALSVSAQDGKQKKVTPANAASSRSVASGKATTPTQQGAVVISVEEQNRALKEGRPSGSAADVDPNAAKVNVQKATPTTPAQSKKIKNITPLF